MPGIARISQDRAGGTIIGALAPTVFVNGTNVAVIREVIAQPIGIKSPIRQQLPGRQVVDQRGSLAQIVGLSRHQAEINQIAERIRQGQYLRRYAAARTSDGLAKSPPFAP